MVDFSDEAGMRKRFHECIAERDAHMAKGAPARKAYEQLRKQEQEIQAQQRELADEFLPHERKAGECSNEASALSRALKGLTGER